MFCIFCKVATHIGHAEEHIIPESLGNPEHVLPRGAVCDGCNNYFSRKIEDPLLNSPIFRYLRLLMQIPNKRGRMPIWNLEDGFNKPDYRLMGRFLGKVGLEVLALKVSVIPSWSEEIKKMDDFNDLRDFVRYNKGDDWPFTVRYLHPLNEVFQDSNGTYFLLNEFDILLTESSETYVVVSLMGVEFVLNLGGRFLSGYKLWLEKNSNISPLYTGNNIIISTH